MPDPTHQPSLSVFFPAYNDSGTIASLVISAVQAAGRLTPDFEVLVVNDGSRDATPHIVDELARVYPQVRVDPPPGQPRLRRRAAHRVRAARPRTASSTPTATRSTIRRRWRSSGPGCGRRRRHGQRLQDQPLRSAPPHRHRPHLPPHGQAAVRAEGARRRLRLPPDAALDLRRVRLDEEQRRHLPGDDEEDSGRGLHDRRGAGAPLPPRVRQVAVLQLPAHRPHRHRRHEAVVGARRPARAPARDGCDSRDDRSSCLPGA